MKRFEWVKGWLTGGTDPADGSVECGDHTEFCLEVTGASVAEKMDKIAEIFYRARMAQFTENNLTLTGVSFGVASGGISPRVMYSIGGGGLNDNYLMSGYWTPDTVALPASDLSLPFLGDKYTENVNIGYLAPFINVDFRDITNRETGMWLQEEVGFNPIWSRPMASLVGISSYYVGVGTSSGVDEQGFRTAFSWYSGSAAGSYTQPNIPIPWITDESFLQDVIYENLEVLVEFGGRIGVVYGGDGLYHPDNRFFIEMRFRANIAGFAYNISSNVIESGFSSTPATYIMRLSSGDISCPLNSTASGLAGNIVHAATEWWPYQANQPPADVWNPATGLPL